MKKFKLIMLILIIAVLTVTIGGLIFSSIYSIPYNLNAKNPVLTLDIEGYGQMEIELYPDYAPNTVSTIIKLAQNGYYNGKVFFGTDGSSIHGGMIKNESTEENSANAVEDVPTVYDLDTSIGPGTEDDYEISIEGEFSANGYEENTLRFERGTIGIYRNTELEYLTGLTTESYNSGNSMFFITTEEISSLNGLYTAFGKVKKGIEIIDSINNAATIADEDASAEQVKYFENLPVIKEAKVETYGVDYGMPKYQEAFDYNAYLTNLLMQQYQ